MGSTRKVPSSNFDITNLNDIEARTDLRTDFRTYAPNRSEPSPSSRCRNRSCHGAETNAMRNRKYRELGRPAAGIAT
ncbi:hypothetical protein CSAL01_02083 [Colletotrichum salicis]|uniref:Uncharacterized protein n=1 Tax=Colletotrichum salicis TaxID=1209931 RepID=A0A135V691_9PEZI|nr:hypothetical protein CSAL01_02083 [Colletotrichum salicis]